MDINDAAAYSSALAQQSVAQEAGIRVFKKALETEANNMMQLLATIPKASNLPSNLGQNVNTSV